MMSRDTGNENVSILILSNFEQTIRLRGIRMLFLSRPRGRAVQTWVPELYRFWDLFVFASDCGGELGGHSAKGARGILQARDDEEDFGNAGRERTGAASRR